jgi:outer membrane protein TolC
MNKRWLKTGILLIIAILNCPVIRGQGNEDMRLSLHDCIQTAIEKNINMVKARLDKEKSDYKVSEVRADLFPQLNASGRFADNLELPLTMVPGELLGRPEDIPLRMGSQYNTSAGISVNQVLYNQTALTGLALSKKSAQIKTLGVEKASENLAKEVAKLYFLTQTTAMQKRLVEDNIVRTRKMSSITRLLADKGMAKQVDYDRISVTLENMNTQLSNTEALYEQQLNMMKYLLEIPIEKVVVLTDTVNMPLLADNPYALSDFSGHIDIQLLEKQKEATRLNQKLVSSQYLPSLSFFGQYGYQGITNRFPGYFETGGSRWSGASYIGLSLSIPLFDGFQKRSKSHQELLEYRKADLTLANAKERFGIDYKNALKNYYNYKINVERQEKNIRLAEKVYAETSLKYREGVSGMSDILQDEMGLSNAQMNYLNALYKFKEAELEIMALTGEIKELIEN